MNHDLIESTGEQLKGKNQKQKEFQQERNRSILVRSSFQYLMGILREVKQLKEEKNPKHNRLLYLMNACQISTPEVRFQKAVRHFRDALNYRLPRNDFELRPNKFIRIIYNIMTSQFYDLFYFYLGFGYMLVSFWEPANQFDTDFVLSWKAIEFEIFVLVMLVLDFSMQTLTLIYVMEESAKKKFIKNKKFSIKIILIILYLSDAIYFYAKFPKHALRFARYLRPFLILFYSRELRRTFKSVLLSIYQILQLVVFFLVITFLAAIVGNQLIGNYDGQIQYDPYSQNFSDVFVAANIMYTVMSFDNYPTLMQPAIQQSQYYYFYFLTFIILQFLVLLPVPVAIVFDAFRTHRCNMVLLDRIKQREALLACFVALDLKEERILSTETFTKLMKEVYYQKRRNIKRIKELYLTLDTNDNGSISINEFFDIIENLEKHSKFAVPLCRDYEIWDKIRHFINKTFYIKKIIRNKWFDRFIFTVLITNIVSILVNMSYDDPFVSQALDTFDNSCLAVYVLEFVLKLIGLGIVKYFEDGWNTFDFSMIIISIFSSILQSSLSVIKSAKQMKTSRVLKVAKLNRIFRGLRGMKAINFLLATIDIFVQVKHLLVRIFLCLPMILTLIPVLIMFIYIWAILGMDLFNTHTYPFKANSPYEQPNTDFNSLGNSLLILFQVCIEAGWSNFTYDYAYKFGTYGLCVLYFSGFDLFIQLVMINFIKGIIWEIFSVVQEFMNQYQQEEQEKFEAVAIESTSVSDKDTKLNRYEIFLGQLTKMQISPIHEENAVQVNFNQFCSQEYQLSEQNGSDRQGSDQQNQANFASEREKFEVPKSEIIPPNYTFRHRVQESKISLINNELKEDVQYSIKELQENILDGQIMAAKIASDSNSRIEIIDFDSINSKKPVDQKSQIINFDSISNNKPVDQKSQIINFESKKPVDSKSQIQLPELTPPEAVQLNDKSPIKHTSTFYSQMSALEILGKRLKSFTKFQLIHDDETQISDSNQTSQIYYFKEIMESIDDMRKSNKKVENDDQTTEPELNQNFIMKQAVLKDLNLNAVKQQETEYFTENYGLYFSIVNEVNLTPLIKVQAVLLDALHNFLSFQNINSSIFFKGITTIEKNICEQLMRVGSSFKFIYQDNFLQWFCINFDMKTLSIKPLMLNEYIWNLIDQVMQDDELYVGLDMFLTFHNANHDQFLHDLMNELKICRQTITSSSVQGVSYQNVLMDFYCIKEEFQQNKPTQIEETNRVGSIDIKKLIVFASSYVGTMNEKRRDSKKMRKQSMIESVKLSGGETSKISKEVSLPQPYLIRMMDTIKFYIKHQKGNLKANVLKALIDKRKEIESFDQHIEQK